MGTRKLNDDARLRCCVIDHRSYGVNFGISWPAFNAFIAAVVRGPARQQYYGINFALVNLGIGAGGVIGGLFVDVGRPDP